MNVTDRLARWQIDQNNKVAWERMKSDREKELRGQGMSEQQIHEAINFEFGANITQQAIDSANRARNQAANIGQRLDTQKGLMEGLLERRQKMNAQAEEALRMASAISGRQRIKKLILGWLAIVLGLIDFLLLIGRVLRIFR